MMTDSDRESVVHHEINSSQKEKEVKQPVMADRSITSRNEMDSSEGEQKVKEIRGSGRRFLSRPTEKSSQLLVPKWMKNSDTERQKMKKMNLRDFKAKLCCRFSDGDAQRMPVRTWKSAPTGLNVAEVADPVLTTLKKVQSTPCFVSGIDSEGPRLVEDDLLPESTAKIVKETKEALSIDEVEADKKSESFERAEKIAFSEVENSKICDSKDKIFQQPAEKSVEPSKLAKESEAEGSKTLEGRGKDSLFTHGTDSSLHLRASESVPTGLGDTADVECADFSVKRQKSAPCLHSAVDLANEGGLATDAAFEFADVNFWPLYGGIEEELHKQFSTLGEMHGIEKDLGNQFCTSDKIDGIDGIEKELGKQFSPADEIGGIDEELGKQFSPADEIGGIDEELGKQFSPADEIGGIDEELGKQFSPADKIGGIDEELGKQFSPADEIGGTDEELGKQFSTSDEIGGIVKELSKQFSAPDEINGINKDLGDQFSTLGEIEGIDEELGKHFSPSNKIEKKLGKQSSTFDIADGSCNQSLERSTDHQKTVGKSDNDPNIHLGFDQKIKTALPDQASVIIPQKYFLRRVPPPRPLMAVFHQYPAVWQKQRCRPLPSFAFHPPMTFVLEQASIKECGRNDSIGRADKNKTYAESMNGSPSNPSVASQIGHPELQDSITSDFNTLEPKPCGKRKKRERKHSKVPSDVKDVRATPKVSRFRKWIVNPILGCFGRGKRATNE